MGGRVVNLRTLRKQQARDLKRKQKADTAPGVSRPERTRAEAENRRVRNRLDGHRLDDPAPDEK